MTQDITQESTYLRSLARRVAAAYVAHTGPAAVLLTGSAAEGEADRYSDLDLILHYDGALPSQGDMRVARERVGGGDAQPLGPHTEREYAETYHVHGVECQVACATVAAWEEDMAAVLEGLDVDSPLQKALAGLLGGVPLHGESLIRRWQERAAAYPDGLARAMVERYLRFFPLWYVQGRVATRDATVWVQQIFVESAQNVLGVLAGLNRVYYSPFQFKRMRAFTRTLRVAPERLPDRLESLFASDRAAAIRELEALVGETIALVRAHMPEVDTASAAAYVGRREQPWSPVEGAAVETTPG